MAWAGGRQDGGRGGGAACCCRARRDVVQQRGLAPAPPHADSRQTSCSPQHLQRGLQPLATPPPSHPAHPLEVLLGQAQPHGQHEQPHPQLKLLRRHPGQRGGAEVGGAPADQRLRARRASGRGRGRAAAAAGCKCEPTGVPARLPGHAVRTQTGKSIVATSAICSSFDLGGWAGGTAAAPPAAAAEQATARRGCRRSRLLRSIANEV